MSGDMQGLHDANEAANLRTLRDLIAEFFAVNQAEIERLRAENKRLRGALRGARDFLRGEFYAEALGELDDALGDSDDALAGAAP